MAVSLGARLRSIFCAMSCLCLLWGALPAQASDGGVASDASHAAAADQDDDWNDDGEDEDDDEDPNGIIIGRKHARKQAKKTNGGADDGVPKSTGDAVAPSKAPKTEKDVAGLATDKDKAAKDKAAKKKRRARIARVIPNYAYLVIDKSQFLGGFDRDFLNDIVRQVKHRRGVKKAEIISNEEIRLEVDARSFRSENIISGLEGVRVEMRVPYSRIEIHVEDGASFPPKSYLTEDDVLIVELPTEVKDAIGAELGFSIPLKMRCIGKLDTPRSNEAALARFEQEGTPLSRMVPFMAVTDLDGDRKDDLFLRLKGVPVLLILNNGGKGGYKVVPLSRPPSELRSLPRCEQSMENYVRVVPRKDVKCLRGDSVPKGFKGSALEIVQHNNSNRLMMWDGKKPKFCEPLGEGAVPAEDFNSEDSQ